MSAGKPSRKPRRISRGLSSTKRVNVYADFDDAGDCFVYIGGSYYQDSAQIHLTVADTLALADWLTQVAAWARQKPRKKTAHERQRK